MERLGISGQVGAAVGQGYRLVPTAGPVRAVVNAAEQTVIFTLPEKDVLSSIVNINTQSTTGQAPTNTAIGGYLNYSLGMTTPFSATDGQSSATLLGDVTSVLFSPWGFLTSETGMQLPAVKGSDQPDIARLSTTYEYDDPQAPHVIRLGDVITTPPGWARGNLMGGFQFASDYSLQPSTITFPTPQIGSNLSVPSTVSLLVNNAQAYNGNLNAGPFALVGIPVLSGLNSITVQTRSPSGQVTTQSVPFYVSATMLKPGLATYSGTVGYLRQNYGTLQDGYSIAATDDTVSYGLSDHYTGTLHLEASPNLGLVGVMLETSGLFGDLSVAAAGSVHQGSLATLASVNYTRSGTWLNVAGGVTVASPGYYDLAAENGAAFPRLNWYTSAGVSLPYHLGSLNAAYTAQISTPTALVPTSYSYGVQQPTTFDGDSRFLVVSYARTFWRSWTFNVSGFMGQTQNETGASRSSGIDFNLSFPLGDEPRGGLTFAAGSSQRPQYGQNFSSLPGTQYGYGVQVQNQIGNYGASYAQFQANTYLTDVSAAVSRFSNQETAQIQANGSIAMLDGLHFSSPTRSAFAVVDIGYPDIPVSLANQPIAKTNKSGEIFIPGLVPNYPNQISVDPTTLPLSANFKSDSLTVVPPRYGGVVVRFPSKPITDVLIRITNVDGSFPAPGSLIYLKGSDTPNTVIGYDGEALIANAPRHLDGYVQSSRGRCRLSADLTITTNHYLKGQTVKCAP